MWGVGTVANIISGIISTIFIYTDTTHALLPESETIDDLGHALQMGRNTLKNLRMVFNQVEQGDFEGFTSLGIKVNTNILTKIKHNVFQDYELEDFKFFFKLLHNSGFNKKRNILQAFWIGQV